MNYKAEAEKYKMTEWVPPTKESNFMRYVECKGMYFSYDLGFTNKYGKDHGYTDSLKVRQ